jgi:Pyridoxamine 5'-phosphate oxidase
MPPLKYHEGQRAVQDEANTRALADHLSEWVGPVAEFSMGADMFLMAHDDGTALRFTVLSGPAPMVEVAGPSRLRLLFPDGADLPPAGRIGGLAMNLSLARRARINGAISGGPDGIELEADETFTLCRKYMAPSLTTAETVTCGPTARTEVPLDDPWLTALLAQAETSFLASVTPAGAADVAHRGGPAGFITLDPTTRTLSWPEFVGDGVFKSAGNVRATGRMTLLVLDTETGDAAEIVGAGGYRNVRTQRSQRLEPLVQFRDHYPVQGEITCTVERALRLEGLFHPRNRIEKALKVTSQFTPDDQAPR